MGTPAPRARPIQQPAVQSRPAAEPPPVSDSVLVERAQRGDRGAFGALVTRYQDRIYNTVYRMCHNHADALDLAQAAFVKAYEALPRFEARANFFTWLFRIAVNGVITHRRSRRSRSVQLGDDGGTQLAVSSVEDASRDPERDEQQQRVTDALARLDEEFRAAVVLKDIEELDYATIGEILSVPIGTVKSRIHRGRMMLREMLGEM